MSVHGGTTVSLNNNVEYNDNPDITKLFLWVTAVESGVLIIAGAGLLFFPWIMGSLWPWDVAPFNVLLLGSIYSASIVATVLTVYFRRWAPARIVAPMILLFTVVVLVVSLVNPDRFDLGHYSTWLWFFLYIGIPLNAGYYMWLQRRRKPYFPYPLPSPWKVILLAPVAVLGLYGLGLLVAPETFTSFWPWSIDAFHGRMYSVAYLTPALGSVLLWRAAAPVESLTMGLTQATGGFVPMIGLVIVDGNVGGKVDWSASGTWLWLASFAILFLTGLGLIWQSRTETPSARVDDHQTRDTDGTSPR